MTWGQVMLVAYNPRSPQGVNSHIVRFYLAVKLWTGLKKRLNNWHKKKLKKRKKLQATSLTACPRDDRIHLERGITWKQNN